MKVGVPLEEHGGERRVALVPAMLPVLAKLGIEVVIQSGAGSQAGFPDKAYEEQKARVVPGAAEVFGQADIIVQVHPWPPHEDKSWESLELLRSGQAVVGLLNPLGAPEAIRRLAAQGATAFALELLPRISRAQPMDALSAMATIAGYKAVLIAASAAAKMYPLMITAAGTLTPAMVLVVGVGVAGLQAIATARRLGAVVHAYDVRPAVKEQVESLGAKFLEMELDTKSAEGSGGYAKAMGEEFYRRQRELMAQAVAESDAVITTAAVPGSKAPVLITADMVRKMRPQSVIVDLAAETGGNCELTRPGDRVVVDGVTILGPVNVPATIPQHASQMYAKNVTSFLQQLVKDGALRLNLEDPVIKDTLVAHQGEVLNSRLREVLGLPAKTTVKAAGQPGQQPA